MPGTVTAEDIEQYNQYNTCDKDVVCVRFCEHVEDCQSTCEADTCL